MRKYIKSRSGFTLVEVAAVMLIGGILIAAASSMLKNYQQQSRIAVTQSRIRDIDTAMQQFLKSNDKLPCPASLTDAPNTPTAGVAIDQGVQKCSTVPATAGVFDTKSTPSDPDNIRTGAVPVRTLNIPEDNMYDGWGRRFIYSVTQILADSTAYSPTGGLISVKDSAGNDIALPAGKAHYVVVSTGEDGIGGYTNEGLQGVPCEGTATLQGANCMMTGAFVKTAITSKVDGADKYDDYVNFRFTSRDIDIIPAGQVLFFDPAVIACPSGLAQIHPSTGPFVGVCSSYKCCKKS